MPSSNPLKISPGAKNWIKKYFHLVESNDISLSLEIEENQLEILHLLSNKTGLVYGIPSSLIYTNHLDTKHYTNDEKLKLLIFETLLFCYKQDSKEDFNLLHFLELLGEFYVEAPIASGIENWFTLFKDKNLESRIEYILEERVKVKSPIFGTNYWLNHLSNCFVFLDVILFCEFLKNQKITFYKNYTKYANFVLCGIVYAAYVDNQVEEKEQRMLWRFLSSANLPKFEREKIEGFIMHGISNQEFEKVLFKHSMLARITLELGIFITKGTHQTSEKEVEKLIELGKLVELNNDEINESFELVSSYLMENEKVVSLISSDSKTHYGITNFSSRWLRILGRNKEKLVNELKESKDLIALIQKSTKHELSKEEKEQVKSQFMDILKSMPSMAIFLLPGGALLLPLILKIVPDLLPSSFKENDLEK